MQYITDYETPLGAMTLASDGISLTALWFDGQKYDRRTLEGVVERKSDIPVFEETKKWLDIYFSGKDPGFTPKIELSGSDFQQMVSQIMLEIPFGETTTYGVIAKEVAKRMNCQKMSAQAVGGAVGRNPISIIVPCHRVVGSNGQLTGYAGGIENKIKLLTLEKAAFN